MGMMHTRIHSRLLTFTLYLVCQGYVFSIKINDQIYGDIRACGSFDEVAHLSLPDDRIRNNPSPLEENGGVAALHNSVTDFGSWTHKCGASLISDRYLLTAAHCFDRERLSGISIGRNNLDEDPSPGRNTYGIEEVFIHPEWKSGFPKYNDIAIIKTNRVVSYSRKVWPYCLPGSYQEIHDYMSVQIAGWGLVNQSHTSPTLRTAQIKIVENSRCDNKWKVIGTPEQYDSLKTLDYPNGLTQQVLCAGKRGIDACSGDSGGPMTYQNRSGLHTVIGLVARGVGFCPHIPILPGFYSNILYYLDWIYSTTGLPRPKVALNSEQHIPQPLEEEFVSVPTPVSDIVIPSNNPTQSPATNVSGQGIRNLGCTPSPFTPHPASRPPLTNRKCGINLQTDKIVNGEIAEFGSWPWMVIFRGSRIISSGGSCSDSNPSCSGWAARGECDTNPAFMHATCKSSCNKCSTGTGPSNWFCGGTLITEQYVLSTAGCFRDDVKIEFARVGEYDLRKSIDEVFGLKAPKPQDIYVECVIRHHSYQRPCLRCNDIALVKLARPAQLHNFFVYPICLPSNPLQDMGFSVSQFQGKLAWATGWGVTDAKNIFTTRTADILQQVNLTIQETQYCHQQKRKYPDSRMILCAGQGDGRDFCRADIGGPLMLSDVFSQRWYVVGVASFGSTICGDRHAQSIFTSIHYYIDWIKQNIM